MKIHRFIIEKWPQATRFELEDRDVVHQMRNVLKLKKGELVVISDGRLDEARARIVEIGPHGIKLEIVNCERNANEPRTKTLLFCAILKKDNFDLVVQKATEVGVTEICPIISKRTVKLDINMPRVIKIAKEAAEQSGRGIVPLVHEPMTFAESLQYAARNDANYFFELGAPRFDTGVLRMKNMDRVGIFIGSEGGWDESEVEAAKSNSFQVVSMSPLVFRAETAAIIATYLITSTYI